MNFRRHKHLLLFYCYTISPYATIHPSAISIILSHRAATSLSWVTMITVFPCSWSFDNALEAIGDDGTVTLHIDSTQGHVIFTTTNEGPLVTEEFKKKIFTRGFSSKPRSNDITNHGYGLNNLLDLIKPYHGQLHLGNIETNDTQYIQFEVSV